MSKLKDQKILKYKSSDFSIHDQKANNCDGNQVSILK